MRMTRLPAIVALLVVSLAVPALAQQAGTPVEQAGTYDVYDAQTFNSLDAGGQEIKPISAAQFEKTLTYNSELYTTNPLDRNVGTGSREMTMCLKPNAMKVVGSRTAWARFAPGSAGTLHAEVATSFNVMLRIWKGPYKPAGQVPRSSLADVYCEDRRTISNEFSEVSPHIEANEVVLLQTLTVCGEVAASATWEQACPSGDDTKPGGSNQLKIRFVPDNADGDEVPDTQDKCPEPGVAPDGCPRASDPRPDPIVAPVIPAAQGRLGGSFTRLGTTRTKIGKLFVTGEVGSRITLRCRGVRCRTFSVRGRGLNRQISVLRRVRRVLRARQQYIATISKPGRLTTKVTATAKRRGGISLSYSCLDAAGRTTRCP